MKIVLLVLSGDPELARGWLRKSYPGADIENISRDQLESATPLSRIRAAALAPSRCLCHCHRTPGLAARAERAAGVWSAGRRASRGARRCERRQPGRIARRQSWRGRHFALPLNPPPARWRLPVRNPVSSNSSRRLRVAPISISHKPTGNVDALRIAYLRSTPSAGSAAGGAATHINGFVNAATELGAKVTVISNDYIAGLDESKLTLIDPEPLGTTRAAFDLRNNLIFSAGRPARDRTHRRLILFISAMAVLPGPESKRVCSTGVPLFLEYNGSEVWIGKHWDMSGMIPLLERFERLNLDAAARIFVVSEVERRNLLRVGIADEKIVVNPNGVDTEKFRPGIGGAAARQELGVSRKLKPWLVLSARLGHGMAC